MHSCAGHKQMHVTLAMASHDSAGHDDNNKYSCLVCMMLVSRKIDLNLCRFVFMYKSWCRDVAATLWCK